jgi:multiple sugar transport system permease protein
MAGTLISSTFAAYGFARIRFRGRDAVFVLALATMMIPGVVTMIPSYILFSKFRWVGTFLPLIAPTFGGSAYYIFLLRQFFKGIPMAYSEAARIEGARELRVLWSIIVPMSQPILITIMIFEFNAKWNDFMGPLLYLLDDRLYTLQIGLRTFQGDFGMIWNQFMAASLLVLLPAIFLFFFFHKYILQSVHIGGLKG